MACVRRLPVGHVFHRPAHRQLLAVHAGHVCGRHRCVGPVPGRIRALAPVFVHPSAYPLPARPRVSNAGMALCDECPPGSVSGGLGFASCVPCTVRDVARGRRNTACSTCPPGHIAIAGNSERAPCLRGSAQVVPTTNVCQSCGPGFAQGRDGETTCPICPRGLQLDEREAHTFFPPPFAHARCTARLHRSQKAISRQTHRKEICGSSAHRKSPLRCRYGVKTDRKLLDRNLGTRCIWRPFGVLGAV
jgi:hypothetical protein